MVESAARTGEKRQASEKPEARILFQRYFKSVGPRTYAAQVKQAGNGNHFLVLTEGKRDEKTGEVRKNKLFLFSEDFASFLKMFGEAADFIRSHPVPEEVRRKREQYWKRQSSDPAHKSGDRGRTSPKRSAAAAPAGGRSSSAGVNHARR